MGKIELEGMEFFAYHGCYQEEQIIGAKFLVDLVLSYDSSEAEIHDHLRDAINYQEVYFLVQHEMKHKSHLLENVASRIIHSLKKAYPGITSASVKVTKVNPAVGGKVRGVSFTLAQ